MRGVLGGGVGRRESEREGREGGRKEPEAKDKGGRQERRREGAGGLGWAGPG